MYGLFEQLLSAAAVHQDGFCAEHFRHFRQYAGAALCYEEVGEHAQ